MRGIWHCSLSGCSLLLLNGEAVYCYLHHFFLTSYNEILVGIEKNSYHLLLKLRTIVMLGEECNYSNLHVLSIVKSKLHYVYYM